MTETQRQHDERMLKIYERNLQYLEVQAASYGPSNLPLHINNQLEEARTNVAEYRRRLGLAQSVPETPSPASVPKQNGGVPAAEPSAILFEIDFQLQPNGARMAWSSDFTGEGSAAFETPFDQVELPLIIRALDVLQYPNYPTPQTPGQEERFRFNEQEQEILKGFGLWGDGRVAEDAYQTIGFLLFQAVGLAGQGILTSVRNIAIAKNMTVSYVFRFAKEAIHIAALPWELLWDKPNNMALFMRGDQIDSVDRYVATNVAVRPPKPASQTLHALALAPRYNIPDSLRESERAARLKTWDKLKADGVLTYDEISPLTTTALIDYLLAAPQKPDIIHYYGHGTFKNGKGYLLFDGENGGKELVSAEQLRQAIAGARLVVLHACESAMVDDLGGLMTGVAPALSIETGAVVAMQFTVRTAAATRFAQIFYDQLLAKRRTLQEAVALARQTLFVQSPDASWYVPTLYIRSRSPEPVRLIEPA